jgi:hypothetical protein
MLRSSRALNDILESDLAKNLYSNRHCEESLGVGAIFSWENTMSLIGSQWQTLSQIVALGI